MNATGSKGKFKPSAAARAEAAAWIARLHGPNRTPEVEAACRRWMADDPERAAAFELLTDTWDKSARLRRRPIEQLASWEQPGFRMSFSRAAFATLAVAVLAVTGTVLYLRSDAIATAIGEQRTLTLEDGTRVHLNTNSRVQVRYDENVRRVELERGEALFDVARRSAWPFIVTAGDRQIRALGTAFIVRREERNIAVTLVEGKVTVSPLPEPEKGHLPRHGAAASAASSADSGSTERPTSSSEAPQGAPSVENFTLVPGQRLTFAGNDPPQLDRPQLDKITAWQRGQVAFDNTVLADAVAEMNRYSNVRMVVEDPEAASIPVSGVFRAGDTTNFARALGRTYGLRIIDGRHEIVVAGKPRPR